MNIEEIARVCHQVNKAYCESLGDNSQFNWEESAQWQKDSAVKGVELHLTKPETSPSDSHNSWMKEKVDTGWVYGEIKDEEAKTHPCMVSFSELPREQQAKDFIFMAIVKAIGLGE